MLRKSIQLLRSSEISVVLDLGVSDFGTPKWQKMWNFIKKVEIWWFRGSETHLKCSYHAQSLSSCSILIPHVIWNFRLHLTSFDMKKLDFSSKNSSFSTKKSRILVIFWHFENQNPEISDEKNIFSSNFLFWPETHIISSICTKYEVLTPKTLWDKNFRFSVS